MSMISRRGLLGSLLGTAAASAIPAGRAVAQTITPGPISNPVTPMTFGAVGDGVADDRIPFRAFSRWLTAGPARTGVIDRVYRIGRASAPYFTSNFLTEGALYIANPNNTCVMFTGSGMILMDNLNPSTNLGDQDHGIFACSIGGQSSGLALLGTPTVQWSSLPAARSQGDAFHIQGYPSTSALGANGNGLIRNIRIGQSRAKWAPQVGAIMCGVAEVDWESHHAEQTLADAYHVNASNRVKSGRISSELAGDDTCAFVTYYDPSVVEGTVPGYSPYFQPSLGAFSNFDCTVGDVVADQCAANGLRLAGAFNVHADSVTATSSQRGFVQDGGLAGGSNVWPYQQSSGCSVGHVTAVACQEGAYFNSFNVTFSGNPSSFWETDTVIDVLEARGCSNWSLDASNIVGCKFGLIDANGTGSSGGGGLGGLSVLAVRNFTFGAIHLKNAGTNSVISGYTNGIAFGSARPTTSIKIGSAWIIGCEFQLTDVTEFTIGSYLSQDSVGNGLYVQSCSDFVIGPAEIDNCNTNAIGGKNALAMVQAQRGEVSALQIKQGANAVTPIQFGGGTTTANASTDVHIKRYDANISQAGTGSGIVFQGGAFGAVNCTVGGSYRNSDGVLRYVAFGTGSVESNGPLTVSTLPTDISEGTRATVNDATSSTFHAAPVGGSNVHTGVIYLGGSWLIG